MRSVVVEQNEVDASSDWFGLVTPCDYLTRASVSVSVDPGASNVDGTVTLYGSNEKPPSYIRQTLFEPEQGTWFPVAGGSVAIGDAGVTYAFAVDIAYRYVAVRYQSVAGTGDLDIKLSLKGWP